MRKSPGSTLPRFTRLLSLQALVHPGTGWTLLSWWEPALNGGRERQAWSRAEYGGLPLTPDLDMGDTRYLIFPGVSLAGKSSPAPPEDVLRLPADHFGLVPVGGEPIDSLEMAPALALHTLHTREGLPLRHRYEEILAERDAAAARLRANPPPVRDIVIRMRPVILPEPAPRAK